MADSSKLLLYGSSAAGAWYYFTVTEKSYSVSDNTSVITLTHIAYTDSNWGAYDIPSSTTINPTVDGTARGATKITNAPYISKGSSATILTQDFTVAHNSDGKKTLTVSCYFNDNYGGSGTASATITLTTIPRASTMTVNDAVLGGTVTFSISAASSSFTHGISVTCGSYSADLGNVSSWVVPDLSGYFSSSETSKNASFTLTTYSSGTAVGTYSTSCTISLPGKNTMSAVSGTMGSAMTLTISKGYSSYKTTLAYTFGNASDTVASQITDASKSWTPPTSLGAQVPNSKSGVGSITVTTYANSTSGYRSLGSTTATLTLSVPSYSLSASFTTAQIYNPNSTVSGWGVAVKGYTQYKWTVTASTSYGASITSYSFSVAGQTSSKASDTTGVFQTSGTATPTMVVTDSRGVSATIKASSFTVYDYGYPTINSSNAYRADSSGAASSSGTYLYKIITATNSYSCGGHNSISCRYRLKTTGGAYGSYISLTNGTAGSLTENEVAIDSSYVVELSVVDTLGSVKAVEYKVPTADITFNLKAGGKGAAFFGYSETDGELTVNGNVKANSFIGKATSAGTADTASEATHATSADSATTASSATTAGSATSAGFASSAGVLQASSTGGSMKLYANNNNEVNFGGTNSSGTICFGYRATDSKPIPSYVVFGGSTGESIVKAGGYIAGNHSSAIGDTIATSGSTSTPNGTWSHLCNLSVPAGVWIVWGCINCPTNTNGVRGISLSTSTSAQQELNMTGVLYRACTDTNTRLQAMRYYEISSATNLSLWGYQNSGSTFTLAGYLYGVRIA